MKKEISAEFWDFIEKYISNNPYRTDVLRQSELQIFIDGQDSTPRDMTKQEARKERNKILGDLYFEAIDNHTQGLGYECDDCHQFKGKCSYCPNCGKKIASHQPSKNQNN